MWAINQLSLFGWHHFLFTLPSSGANIPSSYQCPILSMSFVMFPDPADVKEFMIS
jgi:hypothetical protein